VPDAGLLGQVRHHFAAALLGRQPLGGDPGAAHHAQREKHTTRTVERGAHRVRLVEVPRREVGPGVA
jgi:hypothetical protein